MHKIILKGITWNHSRGIAPLQAASQRFSELHPNVEIVWSKRSLQAFADYSIEKLTEEYDLLIIDHPWVGSASATNCVLPLNEFISADFLEQLQKNSAGSSHISYNYDGVQWALAIDAATPVASMRKDLFIKKQEKIPKTWNDVMDLAKKGLVMAPAIPIDLLMNFYTFCIAHGEVPFNGTELVSVGTGLLALDTMLNFYSLLDSRAFKMNPINVADEMSNEDQFAYCPFAYGYSNYGRKGYGNNILTYNDVVSFNGLPLQTTLGGTGIAVSAFSLYKSFAVDFAQFVCNPAYQAAEYLLNGGQPGYSFGYADEVNNLVCNNFYTNTRATLVNAYLRPRYHGYLEFQDAAGFYIQEFLRGNEKNPMTVLNKLNVLYKESLVKSNKAHEYITA